MPPTNEQLLINSGTVQITPPQAQTQIAPTPVYKEGEINMPSPQAWIGPIDYGFNWYDIGAKAFKVAGDIYKDVLDYNLRRRQQQATQDMTEMQTISVEKPDPTKTLEEQRNWLIDQNTRLKKKAKESLIKQGITEDQVTSILNRTLNPADIVLPATDMNSVLQLVRYDRLTSEEFKTNLGRFEQGLYERARENWLDQSAKGWGSISDSTLTPDQIFENRKKAIEKLRNSTYGSAKRIEESENLITAETSDYQNIIQTSLKNNYINTEPELVARIKLLSEQVTNGLITQEQWADRTEQAYQELADLTKRQEIYLGPTNRFNTIEQVAQQKLAENPNLEFGLKTNQIKRMDIELGNLQRQLLSAKTSQEAEDILAKQRDIFNKRNQLLNITLSSTKPELLDGATRKEFEYYNQQLSRSLETANVEKLKELKAADEAAKYKTEKERIQGIIDLVTPLIDAKNKIDEAILKEQSREIKTPEELNDQLKALKKLDQDREEAVKNLAGFVEDENNPIPQPIMNIINDAKKEYAITVQQKTKENIDTVVNNTAFNAAQNVKQELNKLYSGMDSISQWQRVHKVTRLPTQNEFYSWLVQTKQEDLISGIDQTIAYDTLMKHLPTEKNGQSILNSLNETDAKQKLESLVTHDMLLQHGIGLETRVENGEIVRPSEVQVTINQKTQELLSKKQDANMLSAQRQAGELNKREQDKIDIIKRRSLGNPSLTPNEINKGIETSFELILGDQLPPVEAASVFKFFGDGKGWETASLQLAQNPAARQRFIEYFLQNAAYMNKSEIDSFVSQAFNYVATSSNKQTKENVLQATMFINWLSSQIPSGTNAKSLEVSKYNPQYMNNEFDVYWKSHQETMLRLQQEGITSEAGDILTSAQTLGMTPTGTWYGYNIGGTKIYDFLGKLNDNRDEVLVTYANMLGLTDVSFGAEWDTDKAKAIVTSSSKLGGDFISPLIMAMSSLPKNAPTPLIIDKAMYFLKQQGIIIQPQLDLTLKTPLIADEYFASSTRPVMSGDLMHRTVGVSSPNNPYDPYHKVDPMGNSRLIYGASAPLQLAETANGIVYNRVIPNIKTSDGKAWIPTTEEDASKYKITRDNIIDIASGFYPGSMTPELLKTDPDYPIMDWLFNYYDTNTESITPEKLTKVFEDPIVKNWVYQYSPDGGKTPDDVSASRALWLTRVLKNPTISATPFIEIALNSSSHIRDEDKENPAKLTELRIMRTLDQYEGRFARTDPFARLTLGNQVTESLEDADGRLVPALTSGEPVILTHPFTKSDVIQNSAANFRLHVNTQLQQKRNQNWVLNHEGETWLFIDPLDNTTVTINVADIPHPTQANTKSGFKYNENTNTFKYFKESITVGDGATVFAQSKSHNLIPVRRLK